MIGIFAIDDHFLILEGLYKAFDPVADGIGLVGSAADVEEAIGKVPQFNPDIIVLDLFIFNSDPVENFRRLRSSFPSIPVVILTMEDSLRWQIKMFRLGASAYLIKTEKKETMTSIFQQVASGNLVIPEKVSQVLISKPAHLK